MQSLSDSRPLPLIGRIAPDPARSRLAAGPSAQPSAPPRPSAAGPGRAAQRRAVRVPPLSALGSQTGEYIAGEDEFEKAICQSEVVAVDWMAKWCRKCLYLKPKLVKLMEDDFPGVPLVFVDVNAVPGALVYRQGIKKMPTVAVYRRGEKVAEHIAAEGSVDALMKVKRMLQLNAQPEPVS